LGVIVQKHVSWGNPEEEVGVITPSQTISTGNNHDKVDLGWLKNGRVTNI